MPLVGGLIAGFRRAWNNVSTRWYVLTPMRQQSEFNRLVVAQLADLYARLDGQSRRLAALDEAVAGLRADDARLREQFGLLEEWIAGQDREATELRHDLGELALHARAGRLAGRAR